MLRLQSRVTVSASQRARRWCRCRCCRTSCRRTVRGRWTSPLRAAQLHSSFSRSTGSSLTSLPPPPTQPRGGAVASSTSRTAASSQATCTGGSRCPRTRLRLSRRRGALSSRRQATTVARPATPTRLPPGMASRSARQASRARLGATRCCLGRTTAAAPTSLRRRVHPRGVSRGGQRHCRQRRHLIGCGDGVGRRSATVVGRRRRSDSR